MSVSVYFSLAFYSFSRVNNPLYLVGKSHINTDLNLRFGKKLKRKLEIEFLFIFVDIHIILFLC